MQWHAVAITLSVTFCISLLGLNIYGAIKSKDHRMKYCTIAVILFAWVFWGVYQLVFAYIHEVIF